MKTYMADVTVGHQIAQQTADELADEPFINLSEVVENHKGPYVRVFVPDKVAMSEMYEQIDQYACYIDVVLDE